MRKYLLLLLLLLSIAGCTSGKTVEESTKVVTGAAATSMPTDKPSGTPAPAETQFPTGTPVKEPEPTEESAKPSPTPWGATSESDNFKLVVTFYTDQGETVEQVVFVEGIAFVIQDDREQDVFFDLKEESWNDLNSGETLGLSDCEAWAQISKAKMDQDLIGYEEGVEKRFIESFLYPFFEVETLDSENIQVSNEFITYELTAKKGIPLSRIAQVFLYDKLDTYYEAIKGSGMPPFPRLEMMQELRDRNLFPVEIKLRITEVEKTFQVRTTYEIDVITPEEMEKILKILPQKPA